MNYLEISLSLLIRIYISLLQVITKEEVLPPKYLVTIATIPIIPIKRRFSLPSLRVYCFYANLRTLKRPEVKPLGGVANKGLKDTRRHIKTSQSPIHNSADLLGLIPIPLTRLFWPSLCLIRGPLLRELDHRIASRVRLLPSGHCTSQRGLAMAEPRA